MTIAELRTALERLGVPRTDYSLLRGGYPNECYCLVQDGDGWVVYYSERGHKSSVECFGTESEACEYLYYEFARQVRGY